MAPIAKETIKFEINCLKILSYYCRNCVFAYAFSGVRGTDGLETLPQDENFNSHHIISDLILYELYM